MACGNRRVFIITPGPRYHSLPCCCKGDHCTHLQIPDSSLKLMQGLARLQLLISQRLGGSANCTVISACNLLSGTRNTSPEEALAAFASWGAVHGSNANYTRMALSLGDSYFRRLPAAPPAQLVLLSQVVKRPWCDSSSTPAPRPASRYQLSLVSGHPRLE
jgi:hypothetical protein